MMGLNRAEDGWHAAHRNNYGLERWQSLHASLHRDVEHLCFLNPFLPEEAQTRIKTTHKLEPTTIKGTYTFDLPDDPRAQLRTTDHSDEHSIFVEVPAPMQDPERVGLAPFFFADGASVLLAHSLRACESDHILEVYGTSGSKALVLASTMFANVVNSDQAWPEVRGKLVCNEVSKEKSVRVQRTLRDFLPSVLFESSHQHGAHVLFTSAEPGTPCNSMERNGPYDKILLTAPCVCDRQLLRGDGVEMGKWSAGKIKVSAERQLKLLHNALWQLKEGGILLYSTTSLSPEECDGVVEMLLIKTRLTFVVEIMPLEDDLYRMVPGLSAENTDWGTRLLPDRSPFGPLYFSRLRLIRRTHESVHHIPHI